MKSQQTVLALTREQEKEKDNDNQSQESTESMSLYPASCSQSPSDSSHSNESATDSTSSHNEHNFNTTLPLSHNKEHHPMLSLSNKEKLDCKRLEYADDHSKSIHAGDSSIKEEDEHDIDDKKRDETSDKKRVREDSCLVGAENDVKERDISPTWSHENSLNQTIELRLLVRRREAGALIGKRGINIKRLRETFRSSMFSIPDTGNGPERVVCIASNESSIQPILADITQLLMEKSPEKDEQIELKLLIHSSQAGSIIGIGGQSIKKLRNDSKAAIKIYEICCPFSNERVCAIKAKPPVVVNTIKLIQIILNENPIKGTIKPYDALHFDLMLVDKYGGYLPEDGLDLINNQFDPIHAYNRQVHDAPFLTTNHYSLWRSAQEYRDSCDIPYETGRDLRSRTPDNSALYLHHHHHQHQQQNMMNNLVSTRVQNTSTDIVQANHARSSKERNRTETSGPQVEQVNNSNDELKLTQHNSHTQRYAGRFHPYAQPVNQVDFSVCRPSIQRHQFPVSPHPSRFPFTGSAHHLVLPQQYNRVQNVLSSLSERCRHNQSPCLCMFMPVLSHNEVSQQVPFVRMVDEFGSYSRGGISKRK